MRQFIIKETYLIKGQQRPDSINERMENTIMSLAIVENEYRTQHGSTGISFEHWLSGGVRGLRNGDYRKWYMDALLLPIEGYKAVHGVNKKGDAYYQDKLDRGLITPFTEADVKKRSFSATPIWMNDITLITQAETPESQFLDKEGQEERDKALASWLKKNGFKPDEIEVAIEYLDRRDEGRGVQKELCHGLNVTRGKLQYLIKRLDKFLIDSKKAI